MATKKATRESTTLNPFLGTIDNAQGHSCSCQEIRTGDLTIESA